MIRLFEKLTEIIGWIQIALSPTLLGIGIGCFILYNFQNLFGMISLITLSIAGLITGIVLATNKFKTTGTIQFLSRVMATPELDKPDESGKIGSEGKDTSHNL